LKGSAPGKIRTCDLSLRRHDAEEAKEAQKWLWKARLAGGDWRLIGADSGGFRWIWATRRARWPKPGVLWQVA